VLLCVLIIIVIPHAPATDSGSRGDPLATRVDDYLTRSVPNGFAGAVLLAKDGKVVLSKGYGLADREKGAPVRPSTVFNIGSVTKQFTAAAILKLVGANKIKASDTLSTFFDDVPEDKKDITVHQLLTHTAGISPRTGGPRYDQASRETFLSEFFDAPLDSAPGTRHEYANAGYILLAAIVERASGQGFEEFMRQKLFEPAGMTSTGYTIPKWSEKQLAHGYYFSVADAAWKDWGTTIEQWGDEGVSWYGIGKGDVHSTVEDLYKWHRALQGDTVLPETLRVLYETPFVAENEKGTSHYAYGLAILETDRGTKVVTHNGSNGLFFAELIRYVEDDVVVILLTNVALSGNLDDVAWNIGRMAFEPDYEPRPIPRLSYEVVYRFVDENSVEDVASLSSVLASNHGSRFADRRVLNQIGYQLMKVERCDWSLALLKLNTELFPDDGNLFDSLGEAAMGCGQGELAVDSFERALEIAPDDNCGWCDNSRKNLATLGEASS
jgi:CubicO group peptidase (beta-lactamase class C family)